MWAMFSSVHFSGWVAVLDRGVLGGQAERVPAERMQHVEAAHPLHARDDVANHVVADVADVRVPGRVREHLEAVVLRLGGVLGDLERARIAPPVLPLLLDCLGLVVRHDLQIISHARTPPGRRGRRASARSPARRRTGCRISAPAARPPTRTGQCRERRLEARRQRVEVVAAFGDKGDGAVRCGGRQTGARWRA